jgi:hypothetical protein
MVTSFQRAYTTAIALNNMGVSLLERRCYNQAVDAFGDAVTVMRKVFRYSQGSPAKASKPRRLCGPSTLDFMLQKARYNLANCQRDFDSGQKSDSQMNFCIITEEGFAAVIRTVLQDTDTFASSKTFLVRIELEGKSILECENREPEFEAAIILHNFGNLYMCLASTATSSARTRQHSQSAIGLFELSHTVLKNYYSEDHEFLGQVLPVSILVLRSLVILTSFLGMESDEQAYYSDILDLQDFFLEVEDALAGQIHMPAAAA